MAAVGADPQRLSPGGGAGLHPSAFAQTVALSRRSAVRLFRQPQVWFPGILFPLMLAAVNSAAMSQVSTLPGFPPGATFLQYLLPAVIIQSVLFGGIAGGSEMAVDIQSGFFERLMTSPVARPAILVGRVAGSCVFALAQATFFVLLLWPFGARIEAGLAGVLVIEVGVLLVALAIGSFAAGLGARTGQPEAVQGFFPLVFILLFLSSAFFPTQFMTGTYRTVAENNPISLLIDGMRHQVLYGWDLSEAAQSVGVALGLAVLGILFGTVQMRRRWRGDL